VRVPDMTRRPVNMGDFISLYRILHIMDRYDETISIQITGFFSRGAVFSCIPHFIRMNNSRHGKSRRDHDKILTLRF